MVLGYHEQWNETICHSPPIGTPEREVAFPCVSGKAVLGCGRGDDPQEKLWYVVQCVNANDI